MRVVEAKRCAVLFRTLTLARELGASGQVHVDLRTLRAAEHVGSRGGLERVLKKVTLLLVALGEELLLDRIEALGLGGAEVGEVQVAHHDRLHRLVRLGAPRRRWQEWPPLVKLLCNFAEALPVVFDEGQDGTDLDREV